MNTSAALRLLAAANDDAVLAAWAAVFDEHKMSPECDVSPYDCWEVLQQFLSSGVLSPLEYNSVNMKDAFFNGRRPTTAQIQEVLGRLRYLRANQFFEKESPVSSAKPPMSAFSNEGALSVRRESTGLSQPAQRSGLSAPRTSHAIEAFAPSGGSLAPAHSHRAIAEPSRVRAFGEPEVKPSLPCRKVDANLYRGVGDFNVQMFCCNQEMILQDLSEDETYEGELEDGTDGILHEFLFHCYCQSCTKRFHISAACKVPDPGY
jgi:hypothetical protein